MNIHKHDDTAAHSPLSGVTFTLYADKAPEGGSRGTEDTVTTFACRPRRMVIEGASGPTSEPALSMSWTARSATASL